MTSIPIKLFLAAVGAVLVVTAASPADAARKHKKRVVAQAAVDSKYRGTNLFPAGPVYNGPDYLGDDPDPNIRFQIKRDLGAHYGGND